MRLWQQIALGAAVFCIAIPEGLDSCAIAPPAPLFVAKKRPGNLYGEFLKGRIGVVQEGWGTVDLVAAFRMLSGRPLVEDEVANLYPRTRDAQVDGSSYFSAMNNWMDTRRQIFGDRAVYMMNLKSSANHASYVNCLGSAFSTAAITLAQRAQTWGPGSANLKSWGEAQDMVFANCDATEPKIPSEPQPGMDPLLAADRAYQIAAAHFYSGHWAESRTRFEKIALDTSSPWHRWGNYLAARASLREGVLDHKPEAFADAERRLQAIAKDETSELRESAAQLLEYTQIMAHPGERISGLSETLQQQSDAQASVDYNYLLWARFRPEQIAGADEMTDWLLSITGRVEDLNSKRTFNEWRKRRTPAWLIAALLRTYDRSDMDEVLRAARQVIPGAMEYESVAYYGIRSYVQSGNREAARQWAAEALRQKLTVTGRNLILAERMTLARNFDEFLRDAPRRPEPLLADFDNSEVDSEAPPVSTTTAPLFAADSIRVFNRHIPLSLWMTAAGDPSVPPHLRLQLAQTAWYRVVLLNRLADANTLMHHIVAMQPQAYKTAADFFYAKDDRASRFAAVLIMMRAPILRPFLGQEALNIADLSRLRDDNVWSYWGFSEGCLWQGFAKPGAAAFLTAQEKTAGQIEWDALNKLAGSGSTYFAREVVDWAKDHADDPRVPLALHLAVRGTRIGCKDEETGTYSRQAFQLLHSRYPENPWAKQTKYWFK